VAPWDFNASFGQDWTTRRASAAPVDFYEGANRMFERMLADPDLGFGVRDRYHAMLDGGPLYVGTVLDLIDEEAARIDPSARRDWARWEAEYRSFGRWSDRTDWTTYEQEVEYLKDWVTARHEAVRTGL
jgi:hypothetical protein